jgi:hypothetical protein
MTKVRTGLNLAALRARSALGSATGSSAVRERHQADPGVSRRKFISLSGAAVVGLSPTLETIGTMLLGPADCVADKGRVAFRLGGRDRWVIDTRRFGGRPTLEVHKSDALILRLGPSFRI